MNGIRYSCLPLMKTAAAGTVQVVVYVHTIVRITLP